MKFRILFLFCFAYFMFGVISAGSSSLADLKSNTVDTVRIGKQVWMKHNLDIPIQNGYWYDNDSTANKENGRLYFSSSALAACPKGWHLPSDEEWQELINFLGGDSLALIKLSKGGETGMNLTLAGYRSANSANDMFGKKGEIGFYWTSTVKAEQLAYARTIKAGNYLMESIPYRRANAFSVRYIRD